MAEPQTFTAVVVALIGLAGAALANIDRIYAVVRQVLSRGTSDATQGGGQWTGLFREFRQSTGQEEISEESVVLEVSGTKVTGRITSMRGQQRIRDFEGQLKFDFLIFSFFAADAGRVGAASMVLKGQVESGLLLGYWLGFDPELGKMVTAPYVLTREKNVEAAKAQHKEWLAQPGYAAK